MSEDDWEPQVRGPIVAHRIWRIEEHDGLTVLCGVWYHAQWPPEEEAVAECFNGWPPKEELSLWPKHKPPSPVKYNNGHNSHACGFYGVKTTVAAESWLNNAGRDAPHAIGTVKLWGRVVLHEGGYRAQFAYPVELTVLEPVPRNFDAEELAEKLAEGYGVPVGVEVFIKPPES